jgi:isochorismate pyruvate lyase
MPTEFLNAGSMTDTKSILPENCITMEQVRSGVDATDAALIALLADRFAYMDAAARIKQSRDAVRDEARKAEVINNACRLAEKTDIPNNIIPILWEALVESSITYEQEQWDKING